MKTKKTKSDFEARPRGEDRGINRPVGDEGDGKKDGGEDLGINGPMDNLNAGKAYLVESIFFTTSHIKGIKPPMLLLVGGSHRTSPSQVQLNFFLSFCLLLHRNTKKKNWS